MSAAHKLPAKTSDRAFFRVTTPVTYDKMIVLTETTTARMAMEFMVPRVRKIKMDQMGSSAVAWIE